MLVLGIMSGTSVDGVDYALCEVTRGSVRLRRRWTRKFPVTLQRRVHAAAANEATAYELAQLHHDLGRLYARQAKELGPRADLIGLHGQTIFHNPGPSPATLQIGEPSYLAEALRVPVIHNFRCADIAAGGQGAPLATLFHQVVFAKRGHHICLNNLGGISNVTSLDWHHGKQPRVLAFDTGPANVLMDLAMRDFTRGEQSFDRDGAWASQGTVYEPLLSRWLAHPYFKKSPPKSTGREFFGESFWRAEQGRIRAARLSKFDVLATLTEFTERSIVMSYERHLRAMPESIILCGGGAKNLFLTQRIATALPMVRVLTSDQVGWPPEAIEPAAFALLAYYRWNRMPANLPETTGANRAILLGQITEV
jgi:anhydro-N-acetylmuramic acid kinase